MANGRAEVQPRAVYVCGDKDSATHLFDPTSHLRYTDVLSQADYAVGIRGAECAWEIDGPMLLAVKRGGVLLSYVTDLRSHRS
jgi:hypothetical protein